MNVPRSKADLEASSSTSEREYELRAALWASLVTELRSRLFRLEAAGQLQNTSLDEPLLHEFGMSANGGLLSVWLHANTGKGSWNATTKYLDMAEPWFLSSTGVFEIDGETMNLSGAADRFIAKLSGKWKPASA